MLILFSAALVLFVLAIVLTLQLRHGIPPDQRLLDNAVPLAMRLLDALEDGSDAEILAAVGGAGGLREIRRTIRAIGAWARTRQNDHPDARSLLWASWWAFLFLGWPAWLEMRLRARLPLPVTCIESLSRHYATMCATVDAIASMQTYV